MFQAVWGFEQSWSLLWAPFGQLLQVPVLCLHILYSLFTGQLWEQSRNEDTSSIACSWQKEWVKHVRLCYWTWLSRFAQGFWPKGFCSHKPLTQLHYQPQRKCKTLADTFLKSKRWSASLLFWSPTVLSMAVVPSPAMFFLWLGWSSCHPLSGAFFPQRSSFSLSLPALSHSSPGSKQNPRTCTPNRHTGIYHLQRCTFFNSGG